MKKSKFAIIAIILYVLVCAAIYIVAYTFPSITGALTKTCIVEYDTMKITKHVNAVIVRDEYVIYTDCSGNTGYYVEDNTKTRKGVKVMNVYGNETKSYLCAQTGVVSYYYDGYEDELTPQTIEGILGRIPTDSAITVRNMQRETVKPNEFAYKLINSDVWYTVLLVPAEELDCYKVGSKVTLKFDNGSVEANIENTYDIGETCLVKISTGKYYKDYDKLRMTELDVILNDDKGIIVPNTAITRDESGNEGVYVKNINGEYVFTRINVINTDGENSVVSADTFSEIKADGLTYTVNTVSAYDEVLKNASDKN